MAKLSLNLDERSLKNGMAQIRIRITNRGTNAYVSTGVYVEPEYFITGSLYDPIHRKAYMAIEKRDQVARLVKQIDEWISDIGKVELTKLTANEIRERSCLAPIRKDTQQAVSRPGADFIRWYDEFGDSRRTEKTRDSYLYGGKVLREYCASLGLRTLLFSDIDYARLADYGRWLESSGRSPATRHMLESYVRAAYKEALKRHIVSRENDPYYDYSIRPVPMKDIDRLTAKEMKILMDAKLPTKGMQRARDIAMMSFYLCGANLLDLYEMPKEKRGEVVFVRHKVSGRDQRQVHIRIEPELRALISQYGGIDHLLSFKTSYPNYESFRHKIAHRLAEVSKEIGFVVTMAKVRRTWASIAGSIGISERVIDKSMGHVDSGVTARHYEEYEWNLTADANRKVIDTIINQKK